MVDVKKLEARRNAVAGSEEWQNFRTMIDSVRDFFLPQGGRLRTQAAKGSKINKRRVSDLGILKLNDYVSGLISELVTSSQKWFGLSDALRIENDREFFTDATKIMYDEIASSNFYSEFYRDQKNAGCDGTSCFTVERRDGRLVCSAIPFGCFWFVQDFDGRPDVVWVEKKTTAGALFAKYGDKVSQKCAADAEKDPDKEVCIIYYCAPRLERDPSKRDQKNKPYEFIVYEKDGSHLLEEGGTDLQKYIVYRVKRVGIETLGRGPCIESVCSMAAIERSSKEFEKCARLAGVPIFGVGASMGPSGFRWVVDETAWMVIYNDTGISGPPQTMNPSTNPDFILKYIELVDNQMHKLFYLDYFNPVMDKRNITAYQTREIVGKSQQMVDQLVGPLKAERLNPFLRWVFILLGESGAFGEWGSWEEIQQKMAGGRVNFEYKSRLANSQKRVTLLADLEYAEYVGAIAQAIPDPVMQYEFMIRTSFEKLPEKIREGVNASFDIIRPEAEAKQRAQAFAQAMAKQAQEESMVKEADAVSKAGRGIEQNSPAAMMLGMQ